MSTKDKLISLFMRFPGIGTRQAERFVYFLLRTHPAFIEDLIVSLRTLKSKMMQCDSCYGYFEGNSQKICATCADTNANEELLMVVAKDVDMETVKKSALFDGKYFVLGGLLPLTSKDEHEIRLEGLVGVIKKRASAGLKEVIVALSANPEGDHTTEEIRKRLLPLSKEYGFSVTTLGRGLSTGTELEYSDSETIKAAMENRH